MNKKTTVWLSVVLIALLVIVIAVVGVNTIMKSQDGNNQNANVNNNQNIDAGLPELNEPQDQSPEAVLPKSDDVNTNEAQTENAVLKEIDVEQIDGSYTFTAQIPSNYEVEYVSGTQAINIYNPNSNAENNLEKSQIFIRKFSANDFQTLSTVNILNREETTVGSRLAVRYEIEKKAGIANFAGQPSWRSERHKLIDIRYLESNPSTFYVFAYNPAFGEGNFEEFIDLLQFKETFAGFVDPLANMAERDIIKPYGIFITPSNSPVTPENFRGFHTALDLEALPGEDEDTPVFAICDGTLTRKATASGYGGYMVQECSYNGSVINVLYGHVAPSSFTSASSASKGDQVATLGEGFSSETDGERKHLHLAIQQSGAVDIRGYVQSESELSKWIDPEEVLPFIR